MKKINRKTLEAISGVITGDNQIAPYRTANDLHAFWDDLDIPIDECDFTNVTSRFKETLAVLSHYNRLDNKIFDVLSKVVAEVLDYQNFLDEINKEKSREEIVDFLNSYLNHSELRVVIRKNKNNRPDTYMLQKENQNIISSVNVEMLNHDFVEDQHNKIRQKIQTEDYDGAITNARTLVEAIMQEILKRYGKGGAELEKDLDELYKLLKKEMNLSSNADLTLVFKQILTGLQSLISGFSSLGNKMSERHATKYRPSKHHAELAANAAYTISEFLLSSYEHQSHKVQHD
ncbi:MAG: abortive infection family protein [Alphaproteobacteria bacterium]